MSRTPPKELAERLAMGLLAFPVTHFTEASLDFNEAAYCEHIEWLLQFGPAGVFAAGAAGEFFSLTLEEYFRVVSAAAEQAGGRVPVVAGCGYGTAMARQFARAAEEAGADGLLLMPPYLVDPDPAGLMEHIEAVCGSTPLGVILYNRDNAVLDFESLERVCQRAPNLIGFKDGCGDLVLFRRICAELRGRLITICGMPTAESFAREYFAAGANTYSSGTFNFLPGLAMDFYKAARNRDCAYLSQIQRDFLDPYVEIRKRRKGYAVSILKAGMRAVGKPAGPVRPPLVDVAPAEFESLAILLAGRG